jgi:hypothetical protein
MPAKGFRNATVRESAYGIAERIAAEEKTSVGDVVSRAIIDYDATRAKLLTNFRALVRLAETLPQQ